MAFAFLQPIQLQMKPKSPLLMASDDDEYFSTQRIKTIVKDTGSSMTERGSVLLETESLELSSAAMLGERNTNKKTTINNLKRWEKRLNTIEDSFSIHKISAVVYTLSSFTLMGTAIYRWVMGRQELFATIPEYLQPVMWAFCVSNFFMCTVYFNYTAHCHSA